MLKAEVPEKSEDRGQRTEDGNGGDPTPDLGLSVLNLGSRVQSPKGSCGSSGDNGVNGHSYELPSFAKSYGGPADCGLQIADFALPPKTKPMLENRPAPSFLPGSRMRVREFGTARRRLTKFSSVEIIFSRADWLLRLSTVRFWPAIQRTACLSYIASFHNPKSLGQALRKHLALALPQARSTPG